MLRKSQVGATDYFCVTRNEEVAENIAESLSNYTKFKNVDLNYIWTTGAQELFDLLSEKIEMPVSDLMNYREIELRKNSNNSYLKSSDIEILVSRSYLVMDRFNAENPQSTKSANTEELIFSAPVRISL
jgi:hypothetical protein